MIREGIFSAKSLRLVRWFYLIAFVAALGWLFWARRLELNALLQSAELFILSVALLLSIGQLVLNTGFWTAALKSLGQEIQLSTVFKASAQSLLARYLPGSLWYTLGRASLLRHQGVLKRNLGAVALLELSLSLVVAFGLGTGLLLTGGELPLTVWSLPLCAAFLVLSCSPPAINRVLRWAASRTGEEAVFLSWGRYVLLLTWMIGFWVWSSTTFTIYLTAFPDIEVGSYYAVAGSFMIAWGVGFLSVFAPQGLGVFEVTAAAFLVDGHLAETIIIIAGYRALVLVRDAAVFLMFGVSTMAFRANYPKSHKTHCAEQP